MRFRRSNERTLRRRIFKPFPFGVQYKSRQYKYHNFYSLYRAFVYGFFSAYSRTAQKTQSFSDFGAPCVLYRKYNRRNYYAENNNERYGTNMGIYRAFFRREFLKRRYVVGIRRVAHQFHTRKRAYGLFYDFANGFRVRFNGGRSLYGLARGLARQLARYNNNVALYRVRSGYNRRNSAFPAERISV